MKKFFEFFDDEDLKSKFEIPYLKGEMGDEISQNFKNFPLYKGDKNVRHFVDNVLIQYPILEKFQSHIFQHDGDEFIAFYASSFKPVHEIYFYAQIGMAYVNNTYVITLILKDIEDSDQKNWEIVDYEVTDIKEAYEIVDSFMNACVKLNIIKPEDKFSPSRN